MKLYFSPSTGGFYDEGIHGERKVEVVDEERLAELRIAAADAQAHSDEVVGDPLDEANPPLKLVLNPDCLIPEDAIEISAERHAELMEEQANGKRIGLGGDGLPIAVEHQPSVDEQLAAIRRKRDQALAATDWTQVPDALTAAKRKVWAEHRKELRDLPAIVAAAAAKGTAPSEVPFPAAPS